MHTVTLKERALPLDDQWDVIVVGGGPAGCTSAAAAAREGARTLLVEATGCLGGMGTSGLIPAWMTFGDQQKMVIRGMAQKVFEDCLAGMPHGHPEHYWGPIDAERLKAIYDDLVTNSGAQVLFNTMLSGVEATDGAVNHLIITNKAGLSGLKAPVYVDATGDGDLSVWAGAKFNQGDKDGEVMPSTLCFILTNVDTYAYLYGPPLYSTIMKQILESGRYPQIPDMHCCNNLVGPGAVGFNAGHIWEVENARPLSVSEALVQGRRMAQAFRDALAEFHPKAFGNAFLATTGSLMGVRESRRIIGDYELSVEDYIARRTFADDICRNAYPVDIHNPKTAVKESVSLNYDISQGVKPFGPGESHGIPYRCLTPRDIRNVLVAGRAVSCDRPVQSSIRIMSCCLGMGEAAGIAAAMAATGDADVHAIDTKKLRSRLIEEGGYLPD